MLTCLYLSSSKPMAWKKLRVAANTPATLPLPPPVTVHPRLLEIQSRIAVAKGSEQRELITSAVRLLYPFEPREKQVDCVQWLLYRKEDLVLVAKTSFGKSLVWQILPCLVPGTIVIAILPLLALGAEQASSIQKYLAANAGARPMLSTQRTSARACYATSKWAIILFPRTSNWKEVPTFVARPPFPQYGQMGSCR